jgi:phospholipid/cholesterol/gamma-HCH transport system substrate-binding protein
VGAVIIAAALVAAVGTLWLKGTNWGATLERMDVLVHEVGQLQPGNDVTFRGVSIGRVRDFFVDSTGDAVRVRLELENAPRLPVDAVVVIAPESLFGDWQAEIVSRALFSSYTYFDVPPGGIVENGVRVLAGYALPDISRLTATAEVLSENLAVLTDRIGDAFNEETAENLRQAIQNTQQVSEDIKNMIQQQASTFESVSREVEQTTVEINATVRVARSTLEQMDRILSTGQVDTILTGMSGAARELDDLARNLREATDGLESTLTRVDSTFARVDRMTARIEGGEGALGRLLTDTTLAVRAESVLLSLDSLLQDFRENPGRYVRLTIF